MAIIGTFETQDGVGLEIVYGEPFPCNEKKRPERTIFLAPDSCYVCGSDAPRSCEIFLSEQTALLVGQQGMSLPEVIVAFRSAANRPGFADADRRLAGCGFALSGAYRLFLGRLTSEVLQAITLLFLSQHVFETGRYPAPYDGEWKQRAVSYCDHIIHGVIDPAYAALAKEPCAAAGLARLHGIVIEIIRFIPQSVLVRDFV